jgi:HK97 family phage major capsid protein
MKNIQELKRQLQEKINEARKLNDLSKDEKRAFNDDEKIQYSQIMDAVETLKTDIRKAEREHAEEMGQPYDGEPIARGLYGSSSGSNTGDPRLYRNLFKNIDNRRGNGGFDSWADFTAAVASGRFDPRLQELRAQQLGVGALGGFTVPPEFGNILVDTALEKEVIRPRATVHPMKSNVKHIPAWNGLDRGDGHMFGGLEGQWLAELERATPEVAEWRLMTLEAKKLAIYADVSNELMNNSRELDFAFELKRAMIQAISYTLDRAFIVGDGVGKPLGLLNDPALISVPRTGFPSAVPGDNFIDLVNMFNSLYKGGFGSANWLAHPSVVPELITMTDVNGNLIWQSNAREGVPGKMFDLPVVISEKLPVMGEPGCIMLANLSHYQIGMCFDIYMDIANGPGWYQDYSSFRCVLMADGQGSWDKPATRPDGGQESWCVALQ